MKKFNIAICFTLLSIAASAQKYEPVNPQKDKQEYEGYTIRILPAMGPGYGYDILKGRQLIVHQSYNPFTLSPRGLSKKEDVYKLAKWQIGQLQTGRSVNRGIPTATAMSSELSLQGRATKLPRRSNNG